MHRSLTRCLLSSLDGANLVEGIFDIASHFM